MCLWEWEMSSTDVHLDLKVGLLDRTGEFCVRHLHNCNQLARGAITGHFSLTAPRPVHQELLVARTHTHTPPPKVG